MHFDNFYISLLLLFVISVGLPWAYLQYHRSVTRLYPPRGLESRAEAVRLLAQGHRGLAVKCLRVAEDLSRADAGAEIESIRTGVKRQVEEPELAWLVLQFVGDLCVIYTGIYLAGHDPHPSFFAAFLGMSLMLSGLFNVKECGDKFFSRKRA